MTHEMHRLELPPSVPSDTRTLGDQPLLIIRDESWERMRLIDHSSVLDFWDDPGEDIYDEPDEGGAGKTGGPW